MRAKIKIFMTLCKCCKSKEVKKRFQICYNCTSHRKKMYYKIINYKLRIKSLINQINKYKKVEIELGRMKQKFNELEPYLIIAEKNRILIENANQKKI